MEITRRQLLAAAAVAASAAVVPPAVWRTHSGASHWPGDYVVRPWLLVPADIRADGMRVTAARRRVSQVLSTMQQRLFALSRQQLRFTARQPEVVALEASTKQLSGEPSEMYGRFSAETRRVASSRELRGPTVKHIGFVMGDVHPPPLQIGSNHDAGPVVGHADGVHGEQAFALIEPRGHGGAAVSPSDDELAAVALHEVSHMLGGDHGCGTSGRLVSAMEACAPVARSKWMAAPARRQEAMESALRGSHADLGALLTGAQPVGADGGYAIAFENGFVSSTSQGAFVVAGAIYDKWREAGGYAKVGLPRGPVAASRGAVRQEFMAGELVVPASVLDLPVSRPVAPTPAPEIFG